MTLFRFCGHRGCTLLSAAVYPHPRGRCLAFWYGRRVATWVIVTRVRSFLLAYAAAVLMLGLAFAFAVGLDSALWRMP